MPICARRSSPLCRSSAIRRFLPRTRTRALRILAGSEHVDLLFTDIMMPGGMLGPALAKRARELRPQIQVLFTTGYADASALAGTSGLTAAEVLTKPYRNEDLAMRIRTALDREARVA